MEILLKQIISKLDTMDSRLGNIEADVTSMKADIIEIKADMTEVKADVKAIFNQTADLTEFRTETREQLEDIKGNQEVFIKDIHNTKVDIERLKKKAV